MVETFTPSWKMHYLTTTTAASNSARYFNVLSRVKHGVVGTNYAQLLPYVTTPCSDASKVPDHPRSARRLTGSHILIVPLERSFGI